MWLKIAVALIVVILIIIAWRSGEVGVVGMISVLTATAGLILIDYYTRARGKDNNESITINAINESTTGGAAEMTKIKTVIRTLVRNAKKALTAGAAGAATAGTAGLGGDTIVEIVSLVVDIGMYMTEIALTIGRAGVATVALMEMWAVKFDRGIDGVTKDVNDILRRHPDALSGIVDFANANITQLANMFGSALSTLIPDDMSITGWVVSETIIALVASSPTIVFNVIKSIYNQLPVNVTMILQDPEVTEKIIISAINIFINMVMTSSDATTPEMIKQHVARSTAVNVTAAAALFVPVVGLMLAPAIFLAGNTGNVLLTAGVTSDMIKRYLESSYTDVHDYPMIGQVTDVQALVIFLQRIIPFTIGLLYVLSGDSGSKTDAANTTADAAATITATASLDKIKKLIAEKQIH
jgi:hypothetical protein